MCLPSSLIDRMRHGRSVCVVAAQSFRGPSLLSAIESAEGGQAHGFSWGGACSLDYHKWCLEKARPEPLFRYASNSLAFLMSVKA